MKSTKKIKLPREFRNKWLEALESGKYKQVQEELTNGKTGYCCLGVAGRCLNIPRKAMNRNVMPADLNLEYAKKYPEALVEVVKDDDYDIIETNSTNFANDLANMNDNQGMTFKEIAKYIRSNTRGV